ncbi:competence protein ComK [Metabacillus sp. KIGAM252]|uniref:Competence protein ComK n=1 Tax=Metabacillus flavus TaxID=2823519 RepID=A0ABS5LJ47_9BACI|nr:competence protein ComK [Metabacillus flavus]MBS2970752.1 competence protein ComK [Metabacillus flavus]
MKVVDEYYIQKKTMALESKWDEFGHVYTIIHEEHEKLIIKKPATSVIEFNCVFYGSSYKGRLQASGEILLGQKLLPVCVCEFNDIYMFPTMSPKSDQVIWLAVDHVKEVRSSKNKSVVILSNGDQLFIPLLKEYITSKIGKTSQLAMTLQQRRRFLLENKYWNDKYPFK